MTEEGCPYIHDDIDTLFGVTPCPIEELPTICVCGQPLTYAEEVMFINIDG